MNAAIKAAVRGLAGAACLVGLAAMPGPAAAGNYSYFDRPDEANPNSHAAVSDDVYVRNFGWTWGDVQFRPDPNAVTPNAPGPQDGRQARENLESRDPLPLRPSDAPPVRSPRGKVSMT